MPIHTETLCKLKFYCSHSCVDTLENLPKIDSSRQNPHAEHYGIVRFECYKLNELLSSHMNNIISN